MTLVSIVIPTYNQADFLPAAIQSALHQTYPHIEVVVVNDGSKDNTADVLNQLAKNDPRIRAFHQENQGFAVATNRAIQEAKGEYIAHLDSDDLYEPDKVEKQLKFLQQNPDADLVHTALQVIDIDGKELMQQRGQEEDPDTFIAKMLFRSIMPNPTTIFGRKKDLITVPYKEKYKRSVDYDRALRLAEKFRFKYLDLPLTRWRRHNRNLTNELEKYRLEQLDILRGYGVDKLMAFVDKAHLPLDDKTLLKGNILYNIEMYMEATKYFSQLSTPAGYFYLGNCHFKLKEIESASACYKKCLAHSPQQAACWNNLGIVSKDPACFKKALDLRPDYLDPQHNLTHEEKKFTDRELREVLIPYSL